MLSYITTDIVLISGVVVANDPLTDKTLEWSLEINATLKPDEVCLPMIS